MKKIVFAVVLLLLTGAFALLMSDEETTIEGTLIDSKCYLGSNGLLKGNDHMGVKDCGTLCAKKGIPVALLDAQNQVHVLFNPSTKLADHIGKSAKVTGRMDPGTKGIIATKVEVEKDGTWRKVDLGPDMM